VHCGHHRYLAIAHRAEGKEIAAVELHDPLGAVLQFPDIDAGAKTLARAAQQQAAHFRPQAHVGNDHGEFVPGLAVERVDRRSIENHLADVRVNVSADGHVEIN